MNKTVCICGNPSYGFNCVCEHVKKHPGNIDFSCEFCGLYTASIPVCNKCEAEEYSLPKSSLTLFQRQEQDHHDTSYFFYHYYKPWYKPHMDGYDYVDWRTAVLYRAEVRNLRNMNN